MIICEKLCVGGFGSHNTMLKVSKEVPNHGLVCEYKRVTLTYNK